MAKRVGVILSGCGQRDGSDVAESLITLLALGGLGVGEPPEVMHAVVAAIAPEMPADRPRYLMGVGTPDDLRAGKLNIANAPHRDDPRPIEEGCPCECCASYSRGYLAHLFHAKELLYYRLATVHNLQHYLDLARRARAAIIAGVAGASTW